MRRSPAIIGLLVAVTVTLIVAIQVPAQPAPMVMLSPASGVPGSTVTVDGTGFQPSGPVTVFLDEIGGDPLGQGRVDTLGRFKLQFPIPAAPPGSHPVIACTYYSPSVPCREQASANLQILAPATTTTTTSPTTTTLPLTSQTTEPSPTTTSSLSLGAVTTTTKPDPPGPSGPSGVAFTTTLTSIPTPSGFQDLGPPPFYPDLEIVGVEVTQGIQDMQNRMPLVAGKLTLVRVYVGVDQPEGGPGTGGLAQGSPPPTVGSAGWSPVDGLLQLKRGGETKIIYADNGPITAYTQGSNRHDPDQTLNFILPDGWADGQVTITAFIWSDHPNTALNAESDAGNNFAEGTVVFHQPTTPPVMVWRLDPVSSPVLSPAEYQSALFVVTQSFQMHHPVDTPNFIVVSPALGPGPLWNTDDEPEEWDLVNEPSQANLRMKWIYYQSNLSGGVRFLGLIREGTPTGDYAGLANTPVAWTKPNDTTPAHEAAHFYGVLHAPCKDADGDGVPDELKGGGVDWTYPHGHPMCSIGPVSDSGYYGVNLWSPTLQIYSNDPAHSDVRYPWTGYQHPRWIDTYHYCKMGLVYEIPCNPASIGVPPKVLTPPVDCGPATGNGIQLDLCLAVIPEAPLSQEVGPPGSVALVVAEVPFDTWVLAEVDLVDAVLGHAMQVPSSQALQSDFDFLVEQAKSGNLTNEVMVRVIDSEGQPLIQIPVIDSDISVGQDVELTPTQSVAAVPWPAGAVSLELLVDDVMVDSLAGSAAPVVTIDALDQEPGRRFTLTWSGQDPDGDSLLYSAYWSIDGGATWQVLDTGFPDTAAEVDADALQLPGGQVHLKVTASDGFATGSDVVGPVTVPTGLPTGFVVGPDTVPQHASVEFTFHVNDPEDGPITTGSWSSDLDGELGEGRIVNTRYLSSGTHQIGVLVADSDGNQLTLTKQLEVVESDLPAPRLQGAVPDAELIVALGPSNLDQYPLERPAAGGQETPPTPSGMPMTVIWVTIGGLAVAGAGLVWRRIKDRTE